MTLGLGKRLLAPHRHPSFDPTLSFQTSFSSQTRWPRPEEVLISRPLPPKIAGPSGVIDFGWGGRIRTSE